MNNALARHSRTTAALCLFLALLPAARAQWFEQGPVFSISEENDTVMQTDRYYSQGFKLSYLHTDNRLPNWVRTMSDAIPTFGYTVKATRIGTELGQDIYTPSNISTNGLLVNDRPYAGWLYTGIILQRKGLSEGGRPVLESFQMDLGIIGRDSLADRTQSWAHDGSQSVFDNWAHQLKDEPGLALKYQRSMLFTPGSIDERRYLDFIPQAGFSLGNVETSLRAGGLVRVGFNLPDDFGPQTIHSLTTLEGGRSAGPHGGVYGLYAFLSAEGRAVAYNAFLDGNLWQNSHHVTKEPLVGEFTGGLVFVLPYFELQTYGVYRTHEFTLQDKRGAYGGLALKFKL